MAIHNFNKKKRVPQNLRPLLWSLQWDQIDMQKDKDDIIINVINEGSLAQWRWLLSTYGTKTIRQVLGRHLESEFHPESRHLAQVLFSSHFRHAR